MNAPDESRGALVLELRRAGVADTNVLRAIETTPRELFVSHRLRDLANRNCPLPIACGQTMHAPGLVAQMCVALDVRTDHRVLEIGSGAGYGLAILAQLAREVVSFERFRTLASEARARLQRSATTNVMVHWGDGLAEQRAQGQFDRILAHVGFAAAPEMLFAALAPGGRIVCGLDGREGERIAIVSPEAVQTLGPCRLGRPLTGVSRAL